MCLAAAGAAAAAAATVLRGGGGADAAAAGDAVVPVREGAPGEVAAGDGSGGYGRATYTYLANNLEDTALLEVAPIK